MSDSTDVKLGLKQNWKQFTLLVVINGFVGGMVGLETAVSLVFSEMVLGGGLSLTQFVRTMSERPAQILGLKKGQLTVGADADVTILDPEREWTVRAEDFVSKSKNSPFVGRVLKGMPVATIVRGRVVCQDGRFVSEE